MAHLVKIAIQMFSDLLVLTCNTPDTSEIRLANTPDNVLKIRSAIETIYAQYNYTIHFSAVGENGEEIFAPFEDVVKLAEAFVAERDMMRWADDGGIVH